MVFVVHVGKLTLAISRIVSRNRILCETAFSVSDLLVIEALTIFCFASSSLFMSQLFPAL